MAEKGGARRRGGRGPGDRRPGRDPGAAPQPASGPRSTTGTGTLYLVAGPIGNLEDLTIRAARLLGEVDGVACEDTRRTRTLLTHLGLAKPLTSCHAYSTVEKLGVLVDRLLAGESIAYLTDGGTPGVSDPGAALVRAAREAGIAVVPVPGPSALTAALSVCGFASTGVFFAGFLSPKGGKRRRQLVEAAVGAEAVVCFESPHRLRGLLADAAAVFGEETQVFIGRELTKLHEQCLAGTLASLAGAEIPAKGECTVVIRTAGFVPEPAVNETGGKLKKRLRDVDI